VEEEANKKASEAAKRQRDLKKFGKQVQVSKIQEREKQKGQVLEKIKALKRSNLHQHKYSDLVLLTFV
jgi:rRNA-processing protein EBP2